MGVCHLMIPDVQARDGVDLSYLEWIGKYIMHKRPDVIICIGDFADMPSLSSYDKGKKSFEGRRYKIDIKAAKKAMDLMLGPMRKFNKRAAELHEKRYKPRMVLTLGNHEERILRVAELQPEFEGVVSYQDLPYDDWEVHDYLKPVDIDGISYVHFLSNPFTGKPYGGDARRQLKDFGKSFAVGHKQTLDLYTRFIGDGTQQWGFIAGAAYPHDESYKGYQGNYHWRGLLLLNDVRNGNCNPSVVDLDYLKRRFGDDN